MAAIAVDYFGYVVLEHSIPGLNDISEDSKLICRAKINCEYLNIFIIFWNEKRKAKFISRVFVLDKACKVVVNTFTFSKDSKTKRW